MLLLYLRKDSLLSTQTVGTQYATVGTQYEKGRYSVRKRSACSMQNLLL